MCGSRKMAKLVFALFSFISLLSFVISTSSSSLPSSSHQSSGSTSLTCSRTHDSLSITEQEISSTNISIMMSIPERILFYRYLLNTSVYFEYGSGGSTMLACSISTIQQLYSIENDFNFSSTLLKNNACLNHSYSMKKFFPAVVYIGQTQSFGLPSFNHQPNKWRLYPEMILSLFHLTVHSSISSLPSLSSSQLPDFVLVDGRFRVACVLACLLALPDDALIAVHDFFSRSQYYPILNFLEPVDCIDSLLIGKKRNDFNVEDAIRVMSEYVTDFD